MAFKETKIEDLNFNPFTMINKDWLLITAGNKEKFNTMTASWGMVGEIWNHYVSTVFIRPSRYTLEFVEKEDHYSLCFFDETQRKDLAYLGAHSGRDEDKLSKTSLTVLHDEAAPYFAEAKTVFICRKLHRQVIDPAGFIDPKIDETAYPQKDYHIAFIGSIEKVLVKE